MFSSRLRFLIPTLIFGSVAAGQLVKISLFPGSKSSLNLSDLLLVVASLAIIAALIKERALTDFTRYFLKSSIWKWLLIFLGWALLTLILHVGSYSKSELALGLFYWLRLGMIFLLGSGILYFCRSWKASLFVEHFLIWSAILIGIGFLQWYFVSDFGFMALAGWDPHQGRLLSTFFDPNFFGTFIVLCMSVTLAEALQHPPKKATWYITFLALS